MGEYSNPYKIRFSDIDANGHVNNAAYVNAVDEVRFQFFAEQGFPVERFNHFGIGPIYTRITTQFLREVRMGETVTITLALSGLSPLGMLWRFHHDILKSNGKKAVTIDMEGMVLDIANRKAVPSNPELMQVLSVCPRTADFEVLPEMRRMK
jgi:acyl-CoA thioester hydrolase